jgi:glycosyltransferase involved in cell wall biosynthesis
MKILMVAPTPFFSDRGCHVRIRSEANALRAVGHEVLISTYGLGRDVPGIDTVRTLAIPWYHKLAAGPSWHKYYIDLLLLRLTRTWLRRWRPDVLHAHLHEGAFLAALARGRRRVPLILDYQGSLVDETTSHGFTRPGSLHYRWLKHAERWVEGRVDAILSNSRANAERLRRHRPELAGRIHVIRDLIDTDLFHPGALRQDIHARYGIPRDIPLIVYAGVLSDHQGIGLLLEALARLREHHDFHALVIGYPNEARYRAFAESLGLTDEITFAGRVAFEDLPCHLVAADLAVSAKLPSTEGNGKLCAYLASGLPVVAFDTPINRETIGSAGILVSPLSSVALCRGMERVLVTAELQASLRKRARLRALEHLNADSLGEELCTIYDQVRRCAE